MRHLKSLAKRPGPSLKLPGFTANVVRWWGCDSRLEASRGRSSDFTGESGAATKTDTTSGEKTFSNKRFLLRLRLPNQDSSWRTRPSTERESPQAHEHIVPEFR